jgi:hypothetical protein
MQWLTTLFKLILSSKTVAILGFLSVIAGAIADPQWSGVLPDNIQAWAIGLGGILTTLSRGLVDANGDGIPDIFAFLTGTPAEKRAVERKVESQP